MAPLVSIVIPCFNPGPMLEPCLASCFAQTHPDIEIILVDNNSTDGSFELAQKLGAAQKHKFVAAHCTSQGRAFARNQGFALAHGHYIQWLDADDEMGPNKIARQVAALEENRGADIAYCDWDWRFAIEGARPGTYRFPGRQHEDYLLCLLADHWSPPHAYLLRREVAQRLRALGLWRHETNIVDDREYFSLAAVIGSRFLYVPDCDVRYNHWSFAQATRSTTPVERLRACEMIFATLRTQAEKEPPARFTPEHRWLLNQDWRLYRLVAPDAARARRIPGLDPPEAWVAAALGQVPQDRPLELHAMTAAMVLWTGVARRFPADDLGRLSALIQLRRLISMPPDIGPDDKRDAARLPHVLLFFAPVLMKERLVIHRILARLVEKGVLAEAAA